MNHLLTITDSEFRQISELVYTRAGINLHNGKKQLVQARLGKIIRKEGYDGFQQYFDTIAEDSSGNRLVQLLDTLSTNHTYFFRESDHLDWLADKILPEVRDLEEVKAANEIRIWSAGCSSGEEPYSIAIHLLETGALENARLKMLATDLSTKVIRIANQGVYKSEKLKSVSGYILQRYFDRRDRDGERLYKVKAEINKLITYRKLNLLEPFPFKKQFEVVFCRNVMIYFDKPTQQRVVDKIYKVIRPGGYFVVGHSESLSGISHSFKYVAPTIYKKISV